MAHHMHESEWLDQAKLVPVGQKRRVFHGAERTRALDVWNNEDSWSAYCHRCHTSAIKYKQFLQKVDATVPVFRKWLDHKSLIGIDLLSRSFPDKYKALITMLQHKGVSLTVLADLNPRYNIADDRLVFTFGDVELGRDCTGRSEAKWLKYHKEDSKSFLYLQGKNLRNNREVLVTCEDLFSAAKIRYYTGFSTMCLLGTRFEDAKLVHILENNCAVIACGDGDSGGWDCNRLVTSRCNLHGVPYSVCPIPDGLDPKDLSPEHLNQLLKDAADDISW